MPDSKVMPQTTDAEHPGKKYLLGWIGTVCLLLIIPIKLLRFLDYAGFPLAVGIAPSVLGPAGLLFLLRSSTGRLAHLTLLRTTLLAGTIALGLELLQLVPRPGLLARAKYTFDYQDLVASLLSLLLAYVCIRMMVRDR